MKLAYIILAHKYPEQLIRLVHRLNTENTSFFVHIDKKTDEKIYNQIVGGLSHFQNVNFLERHKCSWGDYSLVKAPINGIKEIFKKNVDFDWLIILSGQDYPIKSNSQIEEFLGNNKGKQFIEYKDYELVPPDGSWPTSGADRVNYWHFRLGKMNFVFPGKLTANSINRYCRADKTWFRIFASLWSGLMVLFPIKRKFPEGFKAFWGSQFWCLSRECVEYIHSLIEQNHAVVRYFRYVDIPDEMFFQTLVLSSEFKEEVVNDNLFYIDWDNPNPLVPRTFVKEDFEIIANNSKLFARKFDMNRDAEILDMIDEKILNYKR